MTLQKLHNTTLTSKLITHSRLKHLSAKIGVTEDIVSRLALGLSLKDGPVEDDWAPTQFKNEQLVEVKTGKSLRGKTLFKQELALWLVALSRVEGKMDSIDEERAKFILNWERGVQMISEQDDGSDWIHLINSIAVD